MNQKYILFFLLIVLQSAQLQAQEAELAEANTHFRSFLFKEAIPLYEQALEKELDYIKTLKPEYNELGNPDHWQRGRKQTEETSMFAKALYEMGYGYQRVAHLMGGNKKNHMTIKRMLSYVSTI